MERPGTRMAGGTLVAVARLISRWRRRAVSDVPYRDGAGLVRPRELASRPPGGSRVNSNLGAILAARSWRHPSRPEGTS
jgi:hypothetical protein